MVGGFYSGTNVQYASPVTSLTNSAPEHGNSCTAHALKLRHAHMLHVVSDVNGAMWRRLK